MTAATSTRPQAKRLLPDLGDLYEPPDLDAANDAWGAACGPAALAAMLRQPVLPLRPHFPDPWANVTRIQTALRAIGVRYTCTEVDRGQTPPAARLPRYGLVLLQFTGRWDAAPVRAQYRYTHWIGVSGGAGHQMVYDANAGSDDGPAGGWVPIALWEAWLAPAIAARMEGSSGGWWARTGIELVDLRGRGSTGREEMAADRALAAVAARTGGGV